MTGAELRAHRKAAGLSHAELAKRTGVSRDAVGCWEAKDVVPTRYGAPFQFCEVRGLRVLSHHYVPARGWGLTMPDPWQARLDALVEAKLGPLRALQGQRAAWRRVLCGAKTRKDAACRNLSEPGKQRCKFHGGKSSGPKTAEGREKIAQAQNRR